VLYRFLSIEVDEDRRRLRRDGRDVEITPKAFDLLLYLLKQGGRVVSRVELLRELWPSETVSEEAISKCIMRARVAAGDVEPRKRIIVTASRRGFRFAPAVEVVSAGYLEMEQPDWQGTPTWSCLAPCLASEAPACVPSVLDAVCTRDGLRQGAWSRHAAPRPLVQGRTPLVTDQ